MNVIFHMLPMLSFKEHWLNKEPCVVTAHSISSGWISICCHCCFTMHCMWFSTCCHSPLSKSNGFCFPCVVIAHMLSLLSFKNQWMQFSLCCHCILSRQWMVFHMSSLLFHLAVDVIFHIFSLLSFKEQWM